MLTSELDHWIDELRRRRWSFYYFPNRHAPEIVAAVWLWHECADVILLYREDKMVAFRTPDVGDPLCPEWVTAFYGTDDQTTTVWVIRWALGLPEPGTDQESHYVHLMSAPASCRVERARPMVHRPGVQA
ncbi:hypothetical protein [Herbihabitans rhizosphaerae]|uniref:hypothetical protein n=1 Tax=Herbihabitans rhizosphaerae TaxID=1872711 RepID=UPI00102BB4C8|nr:hypothetical protein [Herbihabitans rhizosphaerae]